MQPPFPILYEDNHLLVINKPAGIATQGVQDASSVNHQAKKYLAEKYNKPGNVYLGIVSRLDTVTSGVLVLARTSKAAGRLSQQIRQGEFDKRYRTVVDGVPDVDRATWVNHVRKDERLRRMVCCSSDDPQAQEARLRMQVLASAANDSGSAMLEIELLTGRKHQIRIQCAQRRLPVHGDKKYGAHTRMASGIALHSYSLSLEHPTKKEAMHFQADPPQSWASFTRRLTQ